MARIFSTSFNYKNQSYTALVTIGSTSDSPISVYVPDTSLHSILPDGKLTLDSEQKLTSGNTSEKELVESIVSSVKKHEENTPARGLWN